MHETKEPHHPKLLRRNLSAGLGHPTACTGVIWNVHRYGVDFGGRSRDDTAMLVLGIVLAGSGIVLGVREVLQVYWNRCLAFAITPEKLTLLWNGQPVKVIPWGEVIEIFASPGPCERNGRYSTYYGIYISLQYGYESRLCKAKRQILNLHISPDSMRHLEKFPVMRICICGNRKRGQQMAQKIEGYRNAAWAQSYEARTK